MSATQTRDRRNTMQRRRCRQLDSARNRHLAMVREHAQGVVLHTDAEYRLAYEQWMDARKRFGEVTAPSVGRR